MAGRADACGPACVWLARQSRRLRFRLCLPEQLVSPHDYVVDEGQRTFIDARSSVALRRLRGKKKNSLDTARL